MMKYKQKVRLGGPVFGDCSTPDLWIAALQRQGFRAAFCPVGPEASDAELQSYVKAAATADIVIAETGAWSNPLSADAVERAAALETCRRNLDLAERAGARCCVNIAGSRGEIWDGPHPANLTSETFDMIVETVREIIDSVQPSRTFYALETMPWIYPDSPQNYLALLKAIDRRQFGVHFDPVNLINSPQRCFDNATFIRECFAVLGPHIKSCHAKDIALAPRLTVHLDEVRPGLGALDYRAFFTELNRLDADTPVMLEHLSDEAEYSAAASHLRGVAAEVGVEL